MPSFVRTEKCDGCKAQDKTACQYICPHDLMHLTDARTGHLMKAYNQEPEQCWECYTCVKICPQQAIEVRAYADFVPLGGSVHPDEGHRLHHVDHQVPERQRQALQVPDPHDCRRFGRSLRGQAEADHGQARSDRRFHHDLGRHRHAMPVIRRNKAGQ